MDMIGCSWPVLCVFRVNGAEHCGQEVWYALGDLRPFGFFGLCISGLDSPNRDGCSHSRLHHNRADSLIPINLLSLSPELLCSTWIKRNGELIPHIPRGEVC